MKYVTEGTCVKEKEKGVRNKWRWVWLNESDSTGKPFRLWLRKLDEPGKCFCVVCSE